MRPVTLALALVVALSAAPSAALAQQPQPDLATLFELGQLVLDTNGDSVPDLLNASFVLGANPSVVETAAATEVAARLGFETMALDLPLARGVSDSLIPIVIGRGGLTTSGLTTPSVDPASLDSGEGVVAVHSEGERTWLLVLGGDDGGLLAAARLLAGVLPHTRSLSTPSIDSVRADIATALDDAAIDSYEIRLTQARARQGVEGVALLVAEVSATNPTAAADAIRTLADSTVAANDTTASRPAPLAYAGLGEVEVRLAGVPVIRLTGRAEPEPPGPIAARPGNAAKSDMDLSNLYTAAGLLGGDPIPNRVDVMLVPGAAAVDGLPELGARLGLEAAGLAVPLTEPAATLARPASQPTLVLAGTQNVLTQQLVDSGKVALATVAAGEGLIELVPKAFGDKSALVVTGADSAGTARALDQVAVTLPNVGERGKDRPTLDDVEQELWDALAGYSPAGQAAIGLYKLDRIGRELSDRSLVSADVLMSLESADSALGPYVRARAAAALRVDPTNVDVTIDDRDVRRAATVFEEQRDFPSEIDRFWSLLREQVLPAAGAVESIRVEARLSEPPELRARLAEEARRVLIEAGADPSSTDVEILSAFKQGYSWLYERVRPRIQGQPIGEILIRFRRNEPPPEWPQQAMHSPVRWLHEIFPIDEILAGELGIPLERIRFEETTEGPTYQVRVTDPTGREMLSDSFDPKWLIRPFSTGSPTTSACASRPGG